MRTRPFSLVYDVLKTALPQCFSLHSHVWNCGCSERQFPHCTSILHFTTGVYLAVLSYHQFEETKSRHLIRKDCEGRTLLLRMEHFSPERLAQLDRDISVVMQVEVFM